MRYVGAHQRPLNISATHQTYVGVYMLVLGLFSVLPGPAHFAMICSGHAHLRLTGCTNSAPRTPPPVCDRSCAAAVVGGYVGLMQP